MLHFCVVTDLEFPLVLATSSSVTSLLAPTFIMRSASKVCTPLSLAKKEKFSASEIRKIVPFRYYVGNSLQNASTISSLLRKVDVLPRGLYVRGAQTIPHLDGKIPSCRNVHIVLVNIFPPGPSLHISANNTALYRGASGDENSCRKPSGTLLR